MQYYKKDDLIYIVGGGASGFSSAYFLIESGHNPNKIKIFEKTNRIGGHLCTLYFHVISKNDCRIITKYELESNNNKYYINFIDHNNKKQKIDLDSKYIVPADLLATVHGRKKFHNLYTMAKHNDLLPVLVDDGQHYSVSCIMDNAKHKTSYLKNPLWWLHLYKTYFILKKIYSQKAKEYMRYNPNLKYGELLKYLKIEFDNPALTAHHSTIPCLFAICVDDIYDVDAKIISESTEAIMGNFSKSFTKYGFNIYLMLLAKKLKSKGVSIELNFDYFLNKEKLSKPKHIIYACQPWNLPDKLRNHPIIKPYSDEYTLGEVFVTHNKFGIDESDINYIVKNNQQYGVADLDKMRPNKADTGAYIMAQCQAYYPVFTIDEQNKKKKLYDFYDAHNLNFHDIDGIKRLNIWHTSCKVIDKKIDTIQGTYLQGENGPRIWFCNATYNYLIHEGAWEMSMDVVSQMTKRGQMLIMKGYQTKYSRHRIMPKEPKHLLSQFIQSKLIHVISFICLVHILLRITNFKNIFLNKDNYLQLIFILVAFIFIMYLSILLNFDNMYDHLNNFVLYDGIGYIKLFIFVIIIKYHVVLYNFIKSLYLIMNSNN